VTNSHLGPKSALTLLLATCAFTLPWQIQLVLLGIVVLLPFIAPPLHPISQRAAKTFFRFIWFSSTLGTVIVVVNGILIRGDEITYELGPIVMYTEGILFGLETAPRLLLISFSILLLFVSTPIRSIIDRLQESGLPRNIVMLLLLALYFVESLPDRIERIFVAQEARGAAVRASLPSRFKALLTILSPLLLSSLSESVERGTALELRGFLVSPPSHRIHHARPPQNVTLVLLGISALLIAYRILVWLLP
jgi:energy-coupling factor transport system permease protein